EDTRRSAVLTAYVARVLTRINTKNVSPDLKRAFSYLDQRAAEIDEPYLLASYASALIDAKDSTRAKPIIDKLRSLVHSEGNSSYWALETNTPFYGWGIAGRVETTALVVQALSKYCDSSTEDCEADKKLVHGGLLFL